MWTTFAFLRLLSSVAEAYIYVGNPILTVHVDRPAGDLTAASAVLDKIREHKCGGGVIDVEVDQQIDLHAGFSVEIDEGDICGFSFLWTSPPVVTKSGAWQVAYDDDVTQVSMPDAPTGWVTLTPFDVVSGTFSGLAPRLYVSVED